MLGFISIVILSGILNQSPNYELNSSVMSIDTQSHNSSGSLDNYYQEHTHAIKPSETCHCASEHEPNSNLLENYYSEFLK